MQYMEAMQDKSWQDAFAKHVTGDDGLPLGYETLQGHFACSSTPVDLFIYTGASALHFAPALKPP